MTDFFSSLPSNEHAAMPAMASDRDSSAAEADQRLREYEAQLFQISGVEGCALGSDHLTVYVQTEDVARSLPATLGDFAVRPVVTGKIRALTSL